MLPAPGWLKQDFKFETSLGHIMTLSQPEINIETPPSPFEITYMV